MRMRLSLVASLFLALASLAALAQDYGQDRDRDRGQDRDRPRRWGRPHPTPRRCLLLPRRRLLRRLLLHAAAIAGLECLAASTTRSPPSASSAEPSCRALKMVTTVAAACAWTMMFDNLMRFRLPGDPAKSWNDRISALAVFNPRDDWDRQHPHQRGPRLISSNHIDHTEGIHHPGRSPWPYPPVHHIVISHN